MNLTYAQLLEKLKGLSPEQLEQTATVWCNSAEEALPVYDFSPVIPEDKLDGILDVGHFTLTIAY